jgi:hypothetical protein
VLTVANLDTGAVASTDVTPGGFEATPAPYGGWRLALAPPLAELGDRVDVAVPTLREVSAQDRPVDPDGELSVQLPRAWAPDLPAADRRTLEADALAGRCRAPWLVYLGRTDPPEPPDHARLLNRLCRLADQLCLDLVVEARHDLSGGLRWDIRYELPGSDVPARPYRYAVDLPSAVASTTATDALHGLADRSSTASAHFVDPTAGDATSTAVGAADHPDVDQLERRIIQDCGGTSGGQAIWRDGRWWHTTLRPGGPVTVSAGSDGARTVTGLLRNWEPPAPAYLGPPIPSRICPVCQGSGLRAGWLPCSACGGSRRIHVGAVLTVTDLCHRAIHLNWRSDDQRLAGASTLVRTRSGGDAVFQVAEPLRVRRWATVFGVRPEDLTEVDGEHVLDQDLRDGIITLPSPHTDPVGRYLALAGRGRSGARVLVRARPWPGPPLATLARIALGLGLALQVTAQDHGPNGPDPHRIRGVWWEITVVSPGAAVDRLAPLRESLAEAVAYCLRFLGPMVLATVPANPDVPVPVPHPRWPADVPTDLESTLRRLAGQQAGLPVTVRLDSRGLRTYRA